MKSIKTRNLTKKFGTLTAVDSINIEIEKGELFGFLGPNGAGKTTTISMLSTLLEPTKGSAEIAGHDLKNEQDEIRKSIGIVFQDQSLDEELTGYENLDFHGRLYGMKKKLRKERIEEVLELVELKGKAKNQVKKYSGGMRRRLEVARGLMHHPNILFLDEPTLGLDPQTRRKLWEYIKNLNEKEDITIILTTHYMEEADFLCDRVAIIDKGKIIAKDSPSKLKEGLGGDVISLKFETKDNKKFIDKLKKTKWIKKLKEHDGHLDITTKNADKRITKIIELAGKNNIEIETLTINKPTLEEVFLHFTGKTIREKEANEAESFKMRSRARIRRKK
ncbi:MAG: ATP-binding cassette domain-containing protein [Candidatus Undinarchaeales archaeon]